MFCTKCGKDINKGAFCTGCGTKVADMNAPTPTPTPIPTPTTPVDTTPAPVAQVKEESVAPTPIPTPTPPVDTTPAPVAPVKEESVAPTPIPTPTAPVEATPAPVAPVKEESVAPTPAPSAPVDEASVEVAPEITSKKEAKKAAKKAKKLAKKNKKKKSKFLLVFLLIIILCGGGLYAAYEMGYMDSFFQGESEVDTEDEEGKFKFFDNITLGDYIGIELEEVEPQEITDEDLESELEWMVQYTNASVEVSRASKDGDIVNINYSGSINGEQFDGGTAEDYDLLLGSGSFIDTFEEQLEGLSAGDEVEVHVTFPTDYQSVDLAGESAVFDVTINEVKEVLDNVLNDTYVKAVSEVSTTVEEYKEEVRQLLEEQEEESIQYAYKNRAWEYLVSETIINEYDEDILNEYEDGIYLVIEKQASDLDLTLLEYVATAGYDEDSFAEYVAESAEEQYKVRAIVSNIVINESLELSDEDFEEKILKTIEMIGVTSMDAALDSGYTMEDLELNAYLEVVVDFLVANALFI